MKPIKEARSELKQLGCGRAQGDALRFMYANLIAFQHAMSRNAKSIKWPIPCIYSHLGTVADADIHSEARRLMRSYPALAEILD